MKPADVIIRFFETLKKRDFKALHSFYDFNTSYSDEIFPSLTGKEIPKMWEMRFSNAEIFELEYEISDVSRHKVAVKWKVNYKPKGFHKMVENEVKSNFEIDNGLIQIQKDRFDFSKWVKNTRGLIPYLFCFTGITRKKIQERAAFALNAYLLKHH